MKSFASKKLGVSRSSHSLFQEKGAKPKKSEYKFLNSPRESSITKSTPSHFKNTSLVSSIGSLHKHSIDRVIFSPLYRRTPQISYKGLIVGVSSYKLDAAGLIASRLVKFLQKHVNIWKCNVDRLGILEKKTQSKKSLMFSVTVSRENKHFHSASIDVEMKDKGKNNAFVYKSFSINPKSEPTSAVGVKRFNFEINRGMKRPPQLVWPGKIDTNLKVRAFQPIRKKKDYSVQGGKLEQAWNKVYVRVLNETFREMIANYVRQLYLEKFLEIVMGVVKARNCQVCKGLKEAFQVKNKNLLRKNKSVNCLNYEARNPNLYLTEVIQDFKKSFNEILRSKQRVASRVKPLENYQNQNKKVLKKLVLNYEKRFKKNAFGKIRKFSEDKYRIPNAVKRMAKAIMKDTKFRCLTCINHWKKCCDLVCEKNLNKLRVITTFAMLCQIVKTFKLRIFKCIANRKIEPKKTYSFSVTFTRGVKRISAHMKTCKTRAFFLMKIAEIPKKNIVVPMQRTKISRLVSILAKKISIEFTYFQSKISLIRQLKAIAIKSIIKRVRSKAKSYISNWKINSLAF